MYLFYSALLFMAGLIASPYFIYQAIRYGKYTESLRQRLGVFPASFNRGTGQSIWIHAVSVGEALAAQALIPELRKRYPNLRVCVSTTTITGQQVARRTLRNVDEVFYFPFDFAFIINRALKSVRPILFITVDTELWPNFLRICRRKAVKTVLVNGRISSRSYSRYQLVRPFFKHVLSNVDQFCVQSEVSEARLIALGVESPRITVTGSLKFDVLSTSSPESGLGPNDVLRFFRVSKERVVLIAASTLRGEERPVFRAFHRVKQTTSDALLIVAPRHPERFDEVERLARREGFKVARRSELLIDVDPVADVVVLDTIGELARLYEVATIVFVGGSLVNAGGHNILEPAVFGKPIIFGSHMENFSEIAKAFVRKGAACEVKSSRELEEVLLNVMADPERQVALGTAARLLVDGNRGAKVKTLAAIAELLPLHGSAIFAARSSLPFRVVR